MRRRLPLEMVAVLLSMSALGCTVEDVPPERRYSGAEFCLDKGRWRDVMAYAKQFGAAHGLRFAGGANEYEGAGLRIGLVKGGSWFQGEQIALYVLSDPFERRKANLFAITREKMTAADIALARRFEAGLSQFSC